MEPRPTPTIPDVAPVRPPVLEALAARERLQLIVEECAAELDEVVPGLQLRRAFCAGAWVVGVTTGGQWGDGRAFSRLEFHIRVEQAGRRMALTSFATVRNRDLARDETEFDGDSRGFARAQRFVEECCCRFVDRWFDREREDDPS